MLCFLDYLPNFTMVLWLLSLVACTSKFNCDSWAAILILSKAHVVLHKVSLFFLATML